VPRACRAATLLAVVLSGCGGAHGNEGGASKADARSHAGADIAPPSSIAKAKRVSLSSSVLRGGRLPSRYTCDGADVPPPLEWGAVPSGLHELVLFALAARTSDMTAQGPPRVLWSMAGISPRVRKIGAGEIPKGAFFVPGSNGASRYVLCPASGKTEHFRFALYALPAKFHTGHQIDRDLLLHNLTDAEPEFLSPIRGELTVEYSRSV
jgi:hypothetical protein